MKLFKFSVAALLALATAFLGGCSDDDGIDNRDRDYGYVQFKLHKEASYDALSRAQKPQLDYLYEAAKVQVSLGCNGTTVTQTLTLSASDKESAEFGLRSEKLRLLTGQYQIITFSLYNANDELIYNGMPLDDRLVVEAGGLQVHDLTVEGPSVERELGLFKVSGKGEKRVEALRIAEIFRASVVDSTLESFVFEITGTPEKLDAFADLMRPLGLSDQARTGVAALARGA